MFHKTFSSFLTINHCYITYVVSLISRSELSQVRQATVPQPDVCFACELIVTEYFWQTKWRNVFRPEWSVWLLWSFASSTAWFPFATFIKNKDYKQKERSARDAVTNCIQDPFTKLKILYQQYWKIRNCLNK